MTEHAPPATAILESTHSKPKLLVVDDQPINIQILFQTFGSDYQVFMATSGAQALSICKDNPPDLILLDVVMPDMDGFEVCKQLQTDDATKTIPIIFVTAHNDPAQETHGLSLGAVDFIAKPINPAVVRARVKTHLTLKLQSDLLRKLVFLDGLSGVYNRRYFDQQMAIEWARAVRNHSPLSLILIDVDFFKLYNDRYGHQAGDDCLRDVATALRNSTKRPADLLARYGGEEFVCLLPETDHAAAMLLAREMEQRIRNLGIPHERSTIADCVTISLGLATREEKSVGDATDLVSLADMQLYLAKETGRGRACGKVM